MLEQVYLIYRQQEVGSVTLSAVLSVQGTHGKHERGKQAPIHPYGPKY